MVQSHSERVRVRRAAKRVQRPMTMAPVQALLLEWRCLPNQRDRSDNNRRYIGSRHEYHRNHFGYHDETAGNHPK